MQVTGINIPFSGIPIAVFGDHGQLQPVLDAAVWSEKYLDFEDIDDDEDINGDAY